MASTQITPTPVSYTHLEQAGEIAAGKGGSLKVSRETRDIPNGFVLVYGGVEENCTLKAMFEAKRDELADKVNHLIFSQA